MAAAPNPEPIFHGDEAQAQGGREGGREVTSVVEARAEIARLEGLVRRLRREAEENDHGELINRLVSVEADRTRELNAVKAVLLQTGQNYPDVVRTKWMCEATETEVAAALRANGSSRNGSSSNSGLSNGSGRRGLRSREEGGAREGREGLDEEGGSSLPPSLPSSTSLTADACDRVSDVFQSHQSSPRDPYQPGHARAASSHSNSNSNSNSNISAHLTDEGFRRVMTRIDATIRDASFDPLMRQEGRIVGVDWDHMVLRNLQEEYGRAMAELVVAKKKEVERYCPSGSYPVLVLWAGEEGRGGGREGRARGGSCGCWRWWCASCLP
ncbi:putative domain XH [Nannochloropsis gaditana]|uniref:Putative domain XH n=1 Tax=Nannochloropsis gaditana TaxID=72520 RepID=W7T7F9_9STRA|nr:putative domain XH [Nannochloropsis gaditana]